MTVTLVGGLQNSDRVSIRNINTQVSRSLAEKGGKYQLRKSLGGFLQMIQLLGFIVAFDPAIVYLPLTNSPSFLGFLRDCLFIVPGYLFGKKVVIRLHGGYYYYVHLSGWKDRIVRSILGRVALAMVQGERLTQEFNDAIIERRIVVVPNGLDEKPFTAARARIFARHGACHPRRVLFVGLLTRDKGFRDVIEAIAQVPDAHFVFAGEWPSEQERNQVEKYLEEREIAGRVTFAGVVAGDEKYDLFVSSDVFVFPSYFVYEGHAVSVVEALAAGLPIVCTDHGALNESVRDGWNGFFVPRQDPHAVAIRLNQILRDDELRREMGQHSLELFQERFTLAKFVDAWTGAIQRCAEER
jgi:glycosyltransferase involved in cell wall biosynthesis